MITRTSLGLRAALVAVAALGWWTGANAQLTPAGTLIPNRATVNYSVGGQAQAPIESSPTGNTTPGVGAGAGTAFLVDNRVDLTVAEFAGTATVTTPGALSAVLTFTVTNTGNAPQGYRAHAGGGSRNRCCSGNTDNADLQPRRFGSTRIRASTTDGNGTYDAGDTRRRSTS